MKKIFTEKNNIQVIVLAACVVMIVLAAITFIAMQSNKYTPIIYPVYGFSNMNGANGKVYRGIGGAYGEDIAVEASTFTVRDDKIYFAGQIKEDYVISEERTGTICEADLDGNNQRVLVDDAYNLGYGQEKLIGNKIFYPNGFDEDYNTIFAWYDLDTDEKGIIESNRISNILGYDGTCIIYSGYDARKSQNIIGKYNITKNKDKTLFSLGETDKLGGVISLHYYDGVVYAVTLIEEMQNYDARTAVYQMYAYSADSGKKIGELPIKFTGSANYGFLYNGNEVYFATAEWISQVSLEKNSQNSFEVTNLVPLVEREYWGIPHFIPEDGYLYYETIADIDEDTGMNDYFYRVPVSGGEAELLASWFTS